MKQIKIRNRQRRFPVDSKAIRQAATVLMTELLPTDSYELAVLFVNETRMAELNQRHLHHEGPTDIITFDYSTPRPPPRRVGHLPRRRQHARKKISRGPVAGNTPVTSSTACCTFADTTTKNPSRAAK